jgi:hypothetical protein
LCLPWVASAPTSDQLRQRSHTFIRPKLSTPV